MGCVTGSLRVALNLVFLTPGETGGMEVYARELATRLAKIPGIDPIAIVNELAAQDEEAPWSNLVEREIAPVDARDRKQWVLGEQVLVPRIAHRIGAALVHSLASTGPSRWSGGPPRVTTVHDLHYAVAPGAHFGLRALGMRVLVPAAIHGSRRVIADSNATKDDIVRLVGTPPERIDVVPLATAQPLVTPTPEGVLRLRLGLGNRPILLCMAAKRPHKNIEGIIEALAGIPIERRPMLVVPGYKTEHQEKLERLASARAMLPDVRFPGWLSSADVEGLWAIARGHVFPSFYEGFGLPVLEAMRRGVPGACSSRGSLAEVAGDAALLVDPTSPAEIRTAIERLVNDESLRSQVIAAGKRRALMYSWEKTAEQTVASYRCALE
jgi:glycosyltransferase involved in cell wall biosynthesis